MKEKQQQIVSYSLSEVSERRLLMPLFAYRYIRQYEYTLRSYMHLYRSSNWCSAVVHWPPVRSFALLTYAPYVCLCMSHGGRCQSASTTHMHASHHIHRQPPPIPNNNRSNASHTDTNMSPKQIKIKIAMHLSELFLLIESCPFTVLCVAFFCIILVFVG